MINQVVFLAGPTYTDNDEKSVDIDLNEVVDLGKSLLFGKTKNKKLNFISNINSKIIIHTEKNNFLHMISSCLYDFYLEFDSIFINYIDNTLILSSFELKEGTSFIPTEFEIKSSKINTTVKTISEKLNIKFTYLNFNDKLYISFKI